MSLVDFNESIKQSIEAASGGMQTVLVTPKGQLSYMTKIPKFTLADVGLTGTGTHPAFIVNGVEKAYLLIGTYQSIFKNGEFISQPNQSIGTTDLSIPSISTALTAMGTGYHALTYTELAALKLLALKENASTPVLGNTYYGRSSLDATQYGRRADGLDATQGITTGNARILTGSGPVRFRHNQKYHGVSDLVGNGNELASGFRVVNSELQFLASSSSTVLADQYTDTAPWKAIDAITGAFVAPGSAATVKISNEVNQADIPAYALNLPTTTQLITSLTNNSSSPISDAALRTLQVYGFIAPTGSNTTAAYGQLLFTPATLKTTTIYAATGGSTSSGGLFSTALYEWAKTVAQAARICYYP